MTRGAATSNTAFAVGDSLIRVVFFYIQRASLYTIPRCFYFGFGLMSLVQFFCRKKDEKNYIRSALSPRRPFRFSRHASVNFFFSSLFAVVARPENGRTHANVVASHLDGALEIPAHAHAQFLDVRERAFQFTMCRVPFHSLARKPRFRFFFYFFFLFRV